MHAPLVQSAYVCVVHKLITYVNILLIFRRCTCNVSDKNNEQNAICNCTRDTSVDSMLEFSLGLNILIRYTI